ncbi:MAG: hypothetical protein SGJ27_18205 [Candidatus Melainabacteria bacterium]|nr:hypothetical protein [Candidatus Melainabacteria bacterium]
MATKTIARGRDISYSPGETRKPSMMSSWLTGLMLLVIIALVASLLNSAAYLPRTAEGMNGPMVLPEGMPGTMRVRDGNEEALDSIAGVPAGNGAAPNGSIDSKISMPQTDRLPGRDDRMPQPVPAPL